VNAPYDFVLVNCLSMRTNCQGEDER